jgi:hypothetical protein
MRFVSAEITKQEKAGLPTKDSSMSEISFFACDTLVGTVATAEDGYRLGISNLSN